MLSLATKAFPSEQHSKRMVNDTTTSMGKVTSMFAVLAEVLGVGTAREIATTSVVPQLDSTYIYIYIYMIED